MVAALQSKGRNVLRSEHKLKAVAIAYDGASKVSAALHKEAVDAAYQQGYDEASSQYKQQILDFRNEVNAIREGTFDALETKFAEIVGEAREAVIALTYDCVCRTLGGLEFDAQTVQRIVEALIEEAGLNDESMEVRLCPADLALLEELSPEMQARHDGLSFKADESLGRGDCALSSKFGKVDGSMRTKMQRLLESLKPGS